MKRTERYDHRLTFERPAFESPDLEALTRVVGSCGASPVDRTKYMVSFRTDEPMGAGGGPTQLKIDELLRLFELWGYKPVEHVQTKHIEESAVLFGTKAGSE